MTPHAQARQRGDTRGQHYAAEKARKQTTEALGAFVYGKRTVKYKRLVNALVGK